jgi:hypothetical protein
VLVPVVCVQLRVYAGKPYCARVLLIMVSMVWIQPVCEPGQVADVLAKA